MHQPPLEDHLARHTLWPEYEKLYGHGYEISAVAVSHDRSLIATACKASSIDHAVIRLYDAKNEWREIKPSLTAHSLTITSLCFSNSDTYLLSVGRDRQWAVFKREEQNPTTYSLLKSNPKAHSRMILGAAWAPSLLSSGHSISVFATAGRDKCVKIWRESSSDDVFDCVSTIALKSAVTAVSFHMMIFSTDNSLLLAIGEETGQVSVHKVSADNFATQELITLDGSITPSKSITQLTWRPGDSSAFKKTMKSNGTSDVKPVLLAASSEDSSVRIYSVGDIA